MSNIKNIVQKMLFNRTLYIQIMFTALAFVAMVVLSHIFMSYIVRDSLLRTANCMITCAEERVSSSLREARSEIDGFAEIARNMVLRGDSPATIKTYINAISDFHFASHNNTKGIREFYGYFETLPGGPLIIHSDRWLPQQTTTFEQNPELLPWYPKALAADGEIIETTPYHQSDTHNTLITYAKSIFDDNGRRLGVICFDVQIDAIGQRVVETALNQDGYGILLDQTLSALSHPNDTSALPISIAPLREDLLRGGKIRERAMTSQQGEETVVFFNQLPNGWHLGLITPQAEYYQSMSNMAVVLGLLGAALAMALFVILISIDAKRAKSRNESKQKSMFLANMSHEIRTPINAIVGMTSIGMTAADTERKNYCFTKIGHASRHLLGVINDILDISKIEANKFELSVSQFSFDKMLQVVASFINFRLDEKNQKLTVHIDEAIPQTLIADDQRLAQVITNLLGNAVKFTPENGTINLNAKLLCEENNICTIGVEVIDSGIGMTLEQQAKLFQAFQQAEFSTTRKYGGTGLGLVISKSIVELMGGEIRVESELGKGSKFAFTIKAERGHNETGKEHTDATAGTASSNIEGVFAGCHMLLAEDVDINREIVLTMLEPSGMSIDCAENGLQAVEMFSAAPEKYDLIFMDVQMPEMDGYEASRRIRALDLPGAGTIPIVAMTAHVFREDIENCLAAGMTTHLSKPLDMNLLLKTIFAALKKPTHG
ncbi:MAG: response regulator [Deltaproteobacteria bacterium]|jgi:signal transduction histidine kinase|nr:response regulator [Deltaproteobacteria bacterium]